MTIAWAYLIAAGVFEIGWPIGLKWAQEPGGTVVGVAVAVVSMAISGALLYLAQKEISLGTSYAVWPGIGAAGTFLVGVWFFRRPVEPRALARRRAHHRRRHHAEAGALSEQAQCAASVPIPKFARTCSALSCELSESKGHWQRYDASAPLNPKFATALAALCVRTSGSGHQRVSGVDGRHHGRH
jgi:quaternary ammonium compound-resistance protein SugE